jgi:hypothetical protein
VFKDYRIGHLLITQQKGVRAKSGCLRIGIMCPREAIGIMCMAVSRGIVAKIAWQLVEA